MARPHLDSSFYEPIPVLVPAADEHVESRLRHAALMPTEGSGIVVVPGVTGAERLLAYYEPPGDVSTVVTYADRVASAHGRAWSAHLRPGATRRPATHRVLVLPVQALTVIGRYLPREGKVDLAEDPAATELLSTWLRLSTHHVASGTLTAELQTAGNGGHQLRRDIRRCLAQSRNPGDMAHLKSFARQHGHEDLLDEPAVSSPAAETEAGESAPGEETATSATRR